jgi:hypothetical protein
MKRRHEFDQKEIAENGLKHFEDYMNAKITKLDEQFLFVQVSRL